MNGQMFHQYQLNEQPPHWKQKRPRHLTMEIQVLAWDRHKNVTGVNQGMG